MILKVGWAAPLLVLPRLTRVVPLRWFGWTGGPGWPYLRVWLLPGVSGLSSVCPLNFQ